MRNIEFINKRSSTPIIIPKIHVFTITKQPGSLFSNYFKFIFYAAPDRRKDNGAE
jgi:hypothetical protein